MPHSKNQQQSNLHERRNKFEEEYNKEDPYITWLGQPHTITILMIGIAVVTYYAFDNTQFQRDTDTSVKHGLLAVAAMFIAFSAAQMKDGLFFRPHPVFWRCITALGVLYFSLMIFLLFQDVEDAREMLHKLDPRLGRPLPERSYGEDCELYTPHLDHPFRHLWDTINDEFILAHLLGWFGKALLLRDYYLCWILSILFEILEYTFQHMLPNFKECWWDHFILDILVCNWLGFTIGLKVCKYFSMKHYNFIAPNVDEYHWEVLNDWKRLAYAILLIVLISVFELNAFFLKFVLYVPPPNPLNSIRLLIVWGIGLPGVRELYHFATDKNCKKFGPMSWLCIATMSTELLICIKFGKGMFPAPHPDIVVYGWGISVLLFLLWAVWYYGFHKKGSSTAITKSAKAEKESEAVTPSFISKPTTKSSKHD